jgi:hypothetical protein
MNSGVPAFVMLCGVLVRRLLRLVVAMESALADGRYEEAAHLRDEYRKALLDQSREETADSTTESSTADQRKLL